MAPERALVFEIIGTVQNFVNAAERVGLEWLAEEAAVLTGVRDYFARASSDVLDDDSDEDETDDYLEDEEEAEIATPDETAGRLYLGMPTVEAFDRLLTLWRLYAEGETYPPGHSDWWVIFSHLHALRPWGPQDRVDATTRMQLQERLSARPDRLLNVEVDLWYRGDAARRDQALTAFRQTVAAQGGVILDEQKFEEIRYHAALVRLPAAAIDAIVGLTGPLAASDDVMVIRPQAMFRFTAQAVDADEQVETAGLPAPQGAEIAALIDGYPIQNHDLLRDRLDVIELDITDSMAPARLRQHGTAMASLIIHGDLHDAQQAITRRLKVVPILAPDANEDESTPADKLALGVVRRAVVELKEGIDGRGPSGPDVVIINHSICDEAAGFTGSVSPWARMLDWLAYRYNVLFVVSAGNIREPVPMPAYGDIGQLRQANSLHRRNETLLAIERRKSQRTMLAPAEAVNALTVGAVHQDGSQAVLPPNIIDPFGSFASANLGSGLGLGFARSVKPDVLFPGGRQVAQPSMAPGLHVHAFDASGHYGQQVACPDPYSGRLGSRRRSTGTSNAAAVATRAGLQIADMLDASLDGEAVPWYRQPTAPCVLKALISHGAQWGDAGGHMADIYPPAGKRSKQKESVARLLGYGQVDTDRVVTGGTHRITLLGRDLIRKGRRHEYRVPLPDDLSSRADVRTVTVTLAWLTPIRPNSGNYRAVALEMVGEDGKSRLWRGAARQSLQPSVDMSKRGTLIHAVYEGRNPVPFLQGSDFVINVQATSPLSGVTAFDIPYALVVSIQVATTLQADINQSIRSRIAPRIQIR